MCNYFCIQKTNALFKMQHENVSKKQGTKYWACSRRVVSELGLLYGIYSQQSNFMQIEKLNITCAA